MEGLLVVVLLLVIFGLGPVIAMLDVLSRELIHENGRGVRIPGLAKGLIVLFVPFAWIAYFLLFRRRRPFA